MRASYGRCLHQRLRHRLASLKVEMIGHKTLRTPMAGRAILMQGW